MEIVISMPKAKTKSYLVTYYELPYQQWPPEPKQTWIHCEKGAFEQALEDYKKQFTNISQLAIQEIKER